MPTSPSQDHLTSNHFIGTLFRQDGRQVLTPAGMFSAYHLDTLKFEPHAYLQEMGLGLWEPGHYLFPVEWFDYIPEGYIVHTIEGTTRNFFRNLEGREQRYGMLGFGFKHNDPNSGGLPNQARHHSAGAVHIIPAPAPNLNSLSESEIIALRDENRTLKAKIEELRSLVIDDEPGASAANA